MNNPLVYIIEDEKDICQLLVTELEHFSYSARAFHSVTRAQQAIEQQIPDVCIIDLGLPDMDGLTLVRQLMCHSSIGVIILSGRGSLPDRILGLELGADDYICKPFEPREVIARVHSILRRISAVREEANNIAQNRTRKAHFGDWTFDVSTLLLSHTSGQSDRLSVAESELLLSLLNAPKQILSRDQLMYERVENFDRCVDVRVSRIRKKLEHEQKSPALIKTVYGAGYMLMADVSWVES